MPKINFTFQDEKDYLDFIKEVLGQGNRLITDDGFLELFDAVRKLGRYYGMKIPDPEQVVKYDEKQPKK